MPDLWSQSWFVPVLSVVVGLPIVLLVLTEVQSSLLRRGNPVARVIGLLKNFVLPAVAILVLVSQVTAAVDSDDLTWTRIVATVLGFLLILLVLNTVNLALFSNARTGSWRERLPSIFVDIGRLILILVGLAILFSVVWGTDVGGLFTALGVTSIVIGLALQNAVGSVISGLLLLFEQPFRLGDWLDAEGVRGRVIEVNWRAVHIDTGNGVQIVPNASLAGASFTNLSTATGFTVVTGVTFTTDDPPAEVCRLLQEVAAGLPEVVRGTAPLAVPVGGPGYEVSFEINGPALEGQALATLRGRLWYASRRVGLRLDGDATDDFAVPENIEAALRQIAPTFRLTSDDIAALGTTVRLERYAAGEIITRLGSVPNAIRFILRGAVTLAAPDRLGETVQVARVDSGDFIGQTAITREPLESTSTAVTEIAVLVVPVEAVDDLIRRKPLLARDLNAAIDRRKADVVTAMAAMTV